ncbi:putative F-box domain-containing protein [Helianthus annuus]|nr:putative F-box domain-containing protein [Helianthus annuus]
MEPKEEAPSDDGSYEMVNEDPNMELSDESSYELLCSEVSESLVLTDDEGFYNFNVSDEEVKPFSSESAKDDVEIKGESDSDPSEEDMGLDRETNPDLELQPVPDKVNKGKKRDLMTMLYGRSNYDLFDFPEHLKLKVDIKEVAKNHIIRYLPAKSLFKCRQVSKEWNNWISCPFFAHTQSQYFRKTSGFFQNSKYTATRFISLDDSAYGVPYPSLAFLPKLVSVKSSCNGLLLCQALDEEDMFYVCNPANKQWTNLPASGTFHGVDPKFVLAFEPSSLDFEPHYQVICLFSLPDNEVPVVYFDIYDSHTTFWSVSSEMCTDFDASDVTSDAVFVNGVAYWETKGGGLLAFDWKNGFYSVQKVPFCEGGALTNIRGEVCYVSGKYDHATRSCVLDVYGDGVMSLKNTIRIPVDDVEDGEFVDCTVLANSCDDVVALVVKVSQLHKCLYVYHVKDERVQGPVFFSHCEKLFPYVNSLVSLSG